MADEIKNNVVFDVTSAFPAETPLGMAYVPFQEFSEIYDAHTGWEVGTMFPELDLRFTGVKQ